MKAYKKTQKAWEHRNTLRAEGDKLSAEGDKLWAEGDIVFLSAVIEEYGNVSVNWVIDCCRLGNGVVFGTEPGKGEG